MAKIPLKYCEQIKEALKYVDEYRIRNTRVEIGWTELSKEKYYDIYHYDTLIARLYPSSNVMCLFGGYSVSDRDIINSFLKIYNMPYRCYIHKGEMYWETIYQRI